MHWIVVVGDRYHVMLVMRSLSKYPHLAHPVDLAYALTSRIASGLFHWAYSVFLCFEYLLSSLLSLSSVSLTFSSEMPWSSFSFLLKQLCTCLELVQVISGFPHFLSTTYFLHCVFLFRHLFRIQRFPLSHFLTSQILLQEGANFLRMSSHVFRVGDRPLE